MTVINEITPDKIGNEVVPVGDSRRLFVESYSTVQRSVRLRYEDMDIVVDGEALKRAISNALNT